MKQEIEEVIKGLSFDSILAEFEKENQRRVDAGKRPAQGKQSTINALFRKEFSARGLQIERNVFNDPENDLAIDFWKRNVGVDVAFNHRSFIGGDLLRLQAAAEVKNVINVGVYICPTTYSHTDDMDRSHRPASPSFSQEEKILYSNLTCGA